MCIGQCVWRVCVLISPDCNDGIGYDPGLIRVVVHTTWLLFVTLAVAQIRVHDVIFMRKIGITVSHREDHRWLPRMRCTRRDRVRTGLMDCHLSILLGSAKLGDLSDIFQGMVNPSINHRYATGSIPRSCLQEVRSENAGGDLVREYLTEHVHAERSIVGDLSGHFVYVQLDFGRRETDVVHLTKDVTKSSM